MNIALSDKLNNTISQLIAVSDFIKRIGDDNHILDEETPRGLRLIMGRCIDELKKISEAV